MAKTFLHYRVSDGAIVGHVTGPDRDEHPSPNPEYAFAPISDDFSDAFRRDNLKHVGGGDLKWKIQGGIVSMRPDLRERVSATATSMVVERGQENVFVTFQKLDAEGNPDSKFSGELEYTLPDERLLSLVFVDGACRVRVNTDQPKTVVLGSNPDLLIAEPVSIKVKTTEI